MEELMLFRQMVGSDGWLHVTFLTGMLAILVFRRESIEIPGLFKLSILFFAVSLVLPALMVPFVGAWAPGAAAIPSVAGTAVRKAKWVSLWAWSTAAPARRSSRSA